MSVPTPHRGAPVETAEVSNRLLLLGVAFELIFAAAVVAVPALRYIFGTALPTGRELALLLPFPFIVWGLDELSRAWQRRRRPRR